MFYALHELLHTTVSDRRKNESVFGKMKNYYYASLKVNKKLGNFQELMLDHYRGKSDVEFAMKQIYGIFNSIKAILKLVEKNKDSALVLSDVNSGLKKLTKKILLLTYEYDKCGAKRLSKMPEEMQKNMKLLTKAWKREVAKKQGYEIKEQQDFAEKDSANLKYEGDKYFDMSAKEGRKPLDELSLESFKKIILSNYTNSIEELIDIFYYPISNYSFEYYFCDLELMGESELISYYKNRLLVYPMRIPLTFLYNDTHVNQLWNKYIRTHKKKAKIKNFYSEVDEYNGIGCAGQRDKCIYIDYYKDKKMDTEDCDAVKNELDIVYYNIIANKLENMPYTIDDITKQKIEIYKKKKTIINILQTAFDMILNCKNYSEKYYDTQTIRKRIKETELGVVLDKVWHFTLDDNDGEFYLSGYVKDIWYELNNSLEFKNKLTRSELIKMRRNLREKIDVFFEDFYIKSIVSIEDDELISERAIDIHRKNLQRIINSYIITLLNNKAITGTTNGGAGNNSFYQADKILGNYSFYNFSFRSTFYELIPEIKGFINAIDTFNIKIEISEEYDYDAEVLLCLYDSISDFYFSEKISYENKFDFFNQRVSFSVMNFLRQCQKMQNEFFDYNEESDLDKNLYTIFDDILDLKPSSSKKSGNKSKNNAG